MKKTLGIFISIAFSMALSISAFAGQWVNRAGDWFYLRDDNTYVKSGWFMDNDGAWYYFDQAGIMKKNTWIGNYYLGSSGAMLTSTKTPDGYLVGASGEYVNVESDKNRDYMHAIVTWIMYDFYDANSTSANVHKRREDLTSKDKAFLTYAYIYNKKDSRVREQRISGDYYNIVNQEELMSIMRDLTGSSNESDIRAFARYGELKGGQYVIEGSGSFGDAGIAYPAYEGMYVSIEGNRAKVSGDLVAYNGSDRYTPVKRYTAYFTLSNAADMGFLMFDELNVQ